MAATKAARGYRRNTELLLLLAAMPVVVVLFAMSVLNEGEQLTASNLAVPIGLIVAFIAAHISCRVLAPNADPVILPLVFLLSGIGITFVLRLAPKLASTQIMLLFMGVVLMILTMAFVRRIEVFARYKYVIGIAGIILLLLPALIGVEHLGSKIWLSIGGFSIQPGEFAKILIVIFLACYLSDNRELLTVGQGRFNLPSPATMLPLLVMWGIAMAVMVLESDLGSAVLIFGIFVVMLYCTTGRKFYVFLAVALIALGGFAAYELVPHVQVRFQTWVDPFQYAQTGGYQLVQAIYSIADGGLFGAGIGRGYPTLIPVVESDFIFAAIAEEMGLLGASGVLICYFIFAVRGFAVAARTKTDVSALTAIGLTTSIALQAFVIVGGVTRVIPLTGLTLPFMSQGGTSLLASFIIIGLLLRCGDQGVAPGSTEEFHLSSFATDELSRTAMGHRLTVITVCFAILYAVLIGALTYTQVVRADYYQNLPTNNHTIARNQKIKRGSISTEDGVVLAESEQGSNGSWKRVYPQGSLASQVVGYSSVQYGATGIEAGESQALAGGNIHATWEDAINDLAGIPVDGNDVTLTLNSTIQREAQEQLAESGFKGAIVVMDPKTGAVLAMASNPTYDNNDVDDLLSGKASGSDGALLNRATQSLYPPGSSFKVLTLATALETGTATLDSSYSSPASITIGGGEVTNFGGESWGSLTLRRALWYSSNTVFAQLSTDIGANALVASSERFGFNDSDVAQDFSLTASLMPKPSEMTTWETAWAGVGQPVGSHASPAGPQVTVTQMALVYSAIANNGVLMRPYLVKNITGPAGDIVSTTTAQTYAQVVSPSVAEQVRDAMKGVVEEGTGTGAAVRGTTVAGKTGTAEVSNSVENAWFVGMAPADDPKVVVAVMLENGGQGGATAAPIAGDLIETALTAKGVL